MWQNTIVLTIAILSGIANLFLAVYVFYKNPKSRINRNFLFFGLSIFFWCVVNFVFLLVKDLFWLRATYALSFVLALTGTFFSYALSDKKINKWLAFFLSTVCITLFVTALCTPLVLKNIVSVTTFGAEVIFGSFLYFWVIYIFYTVGSMIYVPLSVIKKTDSQKRSQILYYLTGTAIFLIWAVFLDIILPFFGNFMLNNLDSPATLFILGFTSYSIIKYHFMDIKSLLFHSFVYSSAIISIIIVLLSLMFAGSYLFALNLIWPIYVIAIIASTALFFIGRSFFVGKRDLEKAKINLTESLKISERNRTIAETERDKTGIIIRSFSDGLIILDEKNEIFSVNPEAEKILEIKSKNLLKKPIQSLGDFPKAMPLVFVLNAGLANISKREIDLTKDFTVELSAIPLKLNEKDIGHLIVLHDISRQKMVELMKTEFVSLVAHQLRTPLTAVNWSMRMLKNGDFGKLTEKQNEIIEATLHNNDRLISLVSNILNVTHIEEGKYLSEAIMADMKEVVNSVIDNYKFEIEKRKIQIEFEKPDNLPQTMVDVEKMKIAVQNLIDNAIKYSLEGGKIIIFLKNDGKNIEFRIQDFGIGIPKNQQNNIFTKFFRSDNAVRVDPNGTGLGLFITENIVSSHGGKTWFESEEGVGTSFYFNLPILRR